MSEGDEAARLFIPDIAAARDVSARISSKFWQSLRLIATAIGRDAVLDDVAVRTPSSTSFVAYFDLLKAVEEDDLPGARKQFDTLIARLGIAAPAEIQNYGDLAPDVQRQLTAHLSSDPSTRIRLEAPTTADLEAASGSIRDAMRLFEEVAPEISGEIRATIREIVLVSGRFNDTGIFDGATVFSFWGALFLNAGEHRTRIEAIDGLAHESAHAVLFGRSEGTAFVENSDDERYASPLRLDPRPLDGIFHAMFVSARMHYAHASLLRAGVLAADETAVSKDRLRASRSAFDDGYRTVCSHARMTPLGQTLLDASARYMSSPSANVASI